MSNLLQISTESHTFAENKKGKSLMNINTANSKRRRLELLKSLCGSWSGDSRSAEQIIEDIRSRRTENLPLQYEQI